MTRSRRTLLGLGLVVGGVLLGLLALTALPWFRNSLGGIYLFGTKSADLRLTISTYQSAPDIYGVISYGISPVYFRWLGLIVLIVAALLAASTVGFDARASRLTSIAAAVVSLGGLVLTALAIQVIDIDGPKLQRATGKASNPPDYLDYLKATGLGTWAMVLAFVAIGVGALLAAGGREALREALADEPEDEVDAEAETRPADGADRAEATEPTPEPVSEPSPEPTPETAAGPSQETPAEPERPRRENW